MADPDDADRTAPGPAVLLLVLTSLIAAALVKTMMHLRTDVWPRDDDAGAEEPEPSRPTWGDVDLGATEEPDDGPKHADGDDPYARGFLRNPEGAHEDDDAEELESAWETEQEADEWEDASEDEAADWLTKSDED